MTRREFLSNIANGTLSNEVIEMAKTMLDDMDKANKSKAKATSAKRAQENAPIVSKIRAIYEANPKQIFRANEIAEKCEVTTSKATVLLKALANDGYLAITETKSTDGKRKVNGYSLK